MLGVALGATPFGCGCVRRGESVWGRPSFKGEAPLPLLPLSPFNTPGSPVPSLYTTLVAPFTPSSSSFCDALFTFESPVARRATSVEPWVWAFKDLDEEEPNLSSWTLT